MSDGILIFGGTFDPPHVAHTTLPPLAAKQRGCARIIYVPAAINPLKLDSPPAPEAHRLAMLKLAIRDVPEAEISTIELDRAGPSYTIDTLEVMRKRHAGAALHLLIGADQALEFHRWKSWPRIIELAAPAVMVRPPWNRESFEKAIAERYDAQEAERWHGWTLDLPLIDANATDIRRRMAHGEDVSAMLDSGVRGYIDRYRLYGSGAC